VIKSRGKHLCLQPATSDVGYLGAEFDDDNDSDREDGDDDDDKA
jgi:hypothetical protein